MFLAVTVVFKFNSFLIITSNGLAEEFAMNVNESADKSLWSTAATGDKEGVERYLTEGGDANAQDSVFGITPLSWASLFGQTGTMGLLI